MPAIKLKKKTQEYLEEKKREKEALEAATPAKTTPATTPPTPPKKKKEARAPQTPPAYLKENDILFEKRKRTIPVVEQKCQDWIMDNFEKKEEVHVSASKMYEYYTESVLQDAGNVADVGLFNRIVREKLGKYYGVKEMSPLHGIIKEIKPKEKKVQGETLSLKMKDILNEVITEVGNPNKGLRFFNLKQKVGSKYPALQVETYPNKLLNALDRGVRYGSIILVKGSGKCGYYRVPGESTAEEDKPKPKEKKNKGEVEEKEEEENGETGEVPETSGQEEKVKSKKRGKKRKSEEAEEDDGEGKDEQEGEEDSKAAKKKKKRRGKSRTSADRGKAARHGDPTKIEDTFPMALTYMCDPKEASIGKISKYINRYYPAVDTQAKYIEKAMEKGESNGMWQLVGGQTYRLLLEEFNPGYSDDLEDMISQAVIATHEPKIASALMIKKYILQYHENFSVDSRPHLFRKALERACSRGIIRQISGLGCGGSFQLVKSFIPSPAILAGELEDEAEYLDDTVEPDGKDEIYIVRKTKSGRGTGTKERKERKPPASRK
ncbi:heterochromatin protein 1-binding protein 3-like [Ostrea edulis]|uniref:heterochromatin protein 1-binding protein 3-like n=1 Tax=Ostrea edulis TaxID=37623 RepID=UPI0024AF50B4|nr:heterochromatin protein 1-binding protein 3-like [Ostrea edulis]